MRGLEALSIMFKVRIHMQVCLASEFVILTTKIHCYLELLCLFCDNFLWGPPLMEREQQRNIEDEALALQGRWAYM